jgi:hypothetical protein
MAEKIIDSVRDQVGMTPAHMVYVLEVISVRFDSFTPALTS